MPHHRRHSILFACAAIVIWASLATLGVKLRGVPPFLLVGLTLTLAGLISLPTLRQWRVPVKTLAVGVAGLFGYHFFLFVAFRMAPAVEANLLNYLWPLLIVLMSPLLLPGTRLAPRHLLAALAGFVGAGLIVTKGQLGFDAGYLAGYGAAAFAALLWAAYSLLTKRVPPFPTAAVGGFCLASGLLSLACHLALEPTYPLSASDWPWLLLLGAGPMGGAFFLWDRAMKLGDPREIGLLAFATPLLSTMLLVVAGGGVPDSFALIGGSLIIGGAMLGTLGGKAAKA